MKRILVIDDDRAIVETIMSLSSHAYCHVSGAFTLGDGKEMIRYRGPYDVLLLDLQLTDSSTQNTLDQIPALRELLGDRTRIIIITGHREVTIPRDCQGDPRLCLLYKGEFGAIDLLQLMDLELKSPPDAPNGR